MEPKNVLEVKNLEVSFDTRTGEAQAVRKVSFSVQQGEVLALVGESSCGKSVTAQTILKLNPMPPARIKGGSILLDGDEMISKTEKEMEQIRGKLVSMVFQDPMASLDPTMRIGRLIAENLMKHRGISKKNAPIEAAKLLKLVRIPDAEERLKQYPHQLSGGMQQRVMIAAALACSPRLLIADEPTTALDVTIQAQILSLLCEIKEKTGAAILLITHDFGIVAEVAQQVDVMYAGRIMESASVGEIFRSPRHPYTIGLLESLPKMIPNSIQKLASIPGTPPDPLHIPVGCEFSPRCRFCMRICREKQPPDFELSGEHRVSCWLLHPDAPKVPKGCAESG